MVSEGWELVKVKVKWDAVGCAAWMAERWNDGPSGLSFTTRPIALPSHAGVLLPFWTGTNSFFSLYWAMCFSPRLTPQYEQNFFLFIAKINYITRFQREDLPWQAKLRPPFVCRELNYWKSTLSSTVWYHSLNTELNLKQK